MNLSKKKVSVIAAATVMAFVPTAVELSAEEVSLKNTSETSDVTTLKDEKSIVVFEDPTLQKSINNVLGKGYTTAPITPDEMKSISSLTVRGITSLSGIEYASNLKYLDVSDSNLKTVISLSHTKALKTLKLNNCNLDDVSASALKSFYWLERLELKDNNLLRTNFMENLYYLEYVNLSNNEISDLTGFYQLSKRSNALSEINLNNNDVYDEGFSYIKDLRNLTKLSLDNNNITSLDGCINIASTKLASLSLNNNEIKSIDNITNFYQLNEVYLNNNKLDDISKAKNIAKVEANNQKVDYGRIGHLNGYGEFNDLRKPYKVIGRTGNYSVQLSNDSTTGKYTGSWSSNENFSGSLSLTPAQEPYIGFATNTVTLQGLYSGLTVIDWQDGGDLTSQVVIDDSAVRENNYNTGNYDIKYTITDSDGNKTSKSRVLRIESKPTDIVNFSDENLRIAINQQLGYNNYHTITKTDMAKLKELSVKNIDSLEGLQYATNLQKLRAETGNISSVEPLKNLKNLEYVNVNNNKISDLSPLTAVKQISAQNQTIDLGKFTSNEQRETPQIITDSSGTNHEYYLAKVSIEDGYDQYKIQFNESENSEKQFTGKIIATSKSNPQISGGKIGTGMTETLAVNATIDPLEGITATDIADGDLTDKIVVDLSSFDNQKPGNTQIKYTVTDSDGFSVTENRIFSIVQQTKND